CGGRSFAFDPDLAVLEELLLPDGDCALEFAYGPLARLEGRAPVRGAHGDYDGGLAYLCASGAVDYPDMLYTETRVSLRAEPSHLCQGHRRVGFVDEVERSTPSRPLARIA